MIYLYVCDPCEKKFDIIKSASDHRRKEACPECGKVARRVFTAPQLTVDKTVPEYNPAFGKVIRNKRHREYEAKKAGMVEIGNEKPDILCKEADTIRENKRVQRYEQAMKEIANGE